MILCEILKLVAAEIAPQADGGEHEDLPQRNSFTFTDGVGLAQDALADPCQRSPPEAGRQ